MFIPSEDILCPRKLASNVFDKRSVTSTAESFKHWDTCMDNKVCKIVAIVGIVLAVLVVFWVISSVINCICCGANCIRSIFCCCCNGGGNRYRGRDIEEKDPYNNPNMYPPRQQQNYQYQQPMAMQPSYAGNKQESYGYVKDFDDDGVPRDSAANGGNTAAEYYSGKSHQNNYRGQNTYF